VKKNLDGGGKIYFGEKNFFSHQVQ